VKSLEIELQPQEQRTLTAHGTSRPLAYDFYPQGRGLQEFQKSENVDSAITEFTAALEEDPHYALAFEGLGEAYWRRYELEKANNWVNQAQSGSCRRRRSTAPAETDSPPIPL
jgi:tetratricopeptide (TPR) repeat protein